MRAHFLGGTATCTREYAAAVSKNFRSLMTTHCTVSEEVFDKHDKNGIVDRSRNPLFRLPSAADLDQAMTSIAKHLNAHRKEPITPRCMT